MIIATKKILLISSNSSARGGGERYLVFLSRALIKLGIEVHVLLSTIDFMDIWASELDAEGATVHRIPLKSLSQRRLRFLSAILDWNQIGSIRVFCERLKPDGILVNQQYDEDGIDYLQGALNSKIAPVVGIMHMPMTATKNRRPFGKLRGIILRAWYILHPYRLIFVSDGARAEFETYYTHPRPTFVVHNAVPFDCSEFCSPETVNSFVSHTPVIGFVGQFVAQKNLVCLIRAWHMLWDRGVKANLLLVGDGPDRGELEQLLTTIGAPGSWSITGWTKNPENMLSRIDVFVMSSHFEGLPLSLVEAAARGITCVVTPFNGAIDVAKFAPWVHVADEHSESALADILENVISVELAYPLVTPRLIESFRAHFSIHRMANEVVAIMGIS